VQFSQALMLATQKALEQMNALRGPGFRVEGGSELLSGVLFELSGEIGHGEEAVA